MSDKMDDMKKKMKSQKTPGQEAREKLEQLKEKVANTTAPMNDPILKKGSTPRAKSGDVTYLANHEVVSGDTLSGIALKHYGTAVRDKWMAIYEANKEIIGDNPNLIRVGQTLKIPKLD